MSSGVLLNNAGGPYSVLNVNNLTTDITPASGVTGVLFTSNGGVEVNLNAAPFSITTTGDNADGIFAASSSGSVTITSTANISTFGDDASGIRAGAQSAPLTILSTGNIATQGDNAFGIAAGSIYGPVTVNLALLMAN